MANAASFQLVKSELENTIQVAQKSIEAFISDPTDLEVLKKSIDSVNEARGIMVMVEDRGASMLMQELGNLLNELPVQEISKGTARGKVICDAITQALVVANRYLEYKTINNHSLPELLLSVINDVRRARGLISIRESQFYNFKLAGVTKPATGKPFKLDKSILEKIRKYRHMYQAALLFLLRGKRTKAAMSYMNRAITQVDKIAADTKIAPLFWIAAGALEALAGKNSQLSHSRRLLFAQIDRQLRLLLKEPRTAFNESPSEDLIKDLLYIIALCQPQTGPAAEIKQHYFLPPTRFSESFLEEQRELLFSPGASVMSSVSDALKEEMNSVKSMVDNAARTGGGSDFSAKALYQALIKISDILVMLSLSSASNVLKSQADVVGGWADSAAPSTEQLIKIADAVLYAESAVTRLTKGMQYGDGQDHLSESARIQLQEARVALIDEAESGVSLTKRAVTAFIDSEGDTMHLSNVVATLKGVQGALIFLNSQGAANIVDKCIMLVEKQLLTGLVKSNDEKLESFADALSSMEFYLEALLIDENPDPGILKVAKDAVQSI